MSAPPEKGKDKVLDDKILEEMAEEARRRREEQKRKYFIDACIRLSLNASIRKDRGCFDDEPDKTS